MIGRQYLEKKRITPEYDPLCNTPPARAGFPESEIHIWRSILDQSPEHLRELAQMLSSDERDRAQRFRFDVHRERFIAGRGSLRAILAHYLNCKPEEIRFSYGPNGKPELCNNFYKNPLRFNVSHSNRLALYAIACSAEIGVDIEFIQPLTDIEEIAGHFFSPNENAVFHSIPASQKLAAFYNCWTRKEAFIKVSGAGLAHPLHEFDVSLAPGEPARILSISGDVRRAACWSLVELAPAPDYAAAIAYERRGLRVSCFEWTN